MTIDEAHEQQLRWIETENQLPSNDEIVIVTLYDDSRDYPYFETSLGWHWKGMWVVDNEICRKEVIAWMPLPKPYKKV